MDKQGVVDNQPNLNTYVYNHCVKAALDMRLTYQHQNQIIRNVNIAYKISILDILLMLSEFNQRDVYRSVC